MSLKYRKIGVINGVGLGIFPFWDQARQVRQYNACNRFHESLVDL